MAVGFKSQFKRDSGTRPTYHGSAVIERLDTFLSMHIYTDQPDLGKAGIALDVSRVSGFSKRQFDVENLWRRYLVR